MRGIFHAACNEITVSFNNGAWKPSQKGQCWKKKPANKDLTYEIYFQSSTKNTENYIDIIPHIRIYSSKAKAYDIAQTGNQYCQGIVFSEDLGTLSPRNHHVTWNIAGDKYQNNVDEIADFFVKYGLPVFTLFDNAETAIEKLKERGTLFYDYMVKEGDTLMPLTYILLYGTKEDAEQFFNGHVKRCTYKHRIYELYKSLETADKIDLCFHEFYQAGFVKQAYMEGLRLYPEVEA